MIDRLREGLELVDQALATVPADPQPYSHDWMSRRSLLDQRTELRQAMVAELIASQRPALELVFETRGEDSLSADFVGRTLLRIQETVTAVGQAISGKARRAGPVQRDIQERTELRFVGVAYGSFGFVLEGPLEPVQTSLIPEDRLFGLLEEAVVRIFDVVETASAPGANEEDLANAVADLGQRAVSQLQFLTTVLAERSGYINMVWHGPEVRERSLNLDAIRAGGLSTFLAGVDTETSQVELSGRLVGARMDRDTFYFRSDDANKIYQGAIAEESEAKVRGFFDRDCRALLEVTTTRVRASGREAYRYVLVDLFPPESASDH